MITSLTCGAGNCAAVAALADTVGLHRLAVRVAAVELAWVQQDPDVPAYTWHTVTRIPLGGDLA